MRGLAKTYLIAAVAGCSVLAATDAHAGDALTKMATSVIHAGVTDRSTSPTLRLPANRLDLPANRLDLPANRLDLAPPTLPFGTGEKTTGFFPNSNRHIEAVAGTGEKLGALSGLIGNQRVPSRAEQLVRNFHRDGLPVARLFQSENSLVHLGLNQKGKPGLWIVEKVH